MTWEDKTSVIGSNKKSPQYVRKKREEAMKKPSNNIGNDAFITAT